jgi:hypothetical protein
VPGVRGRQRFQKILEIGCNYQRAPAKLVSGQPTIFDCSVNGVSADPDARHDLRNGESDGSAGVVHYPSLFG